MGALVEAAIQRSVHALVDGERKLAEAVIRDEPRINELEMKADYESTRLLSLYQPVARDLRFLTVALKISKDLERVGDIAVNIAERVFSLLEQPPVTPGRPAQARTTGGIDVAPFPRCVHEWRRSA